MARYRRGWNGLTQINPDPVFIPENMELNVFPVPKRPKIEVVAVRKRSHKNSILWGITFAAFTVMVMAGCTLQRPTAAAFIVMGLCGAWITFFLKVNEGRG